MSDETLRFEVDTTLEDEPLVLDTQPAHLTRVVVGCFSNEQAERIAAFLNGEFQREGRA